MKKYVIMMSAVCALCAYAEEIEVTKVMYAGPFALPQAVVAGDTSSIGKNVALDALSVERLTYDQYATLPGLAPSADTRALHVIAFDAENRSYGKASVTVDGITDYEVYCDGKKMAPGEAAMHPATHRFTIKYMSEPGSADSLSVKLSSDKDGLMQIVEDGKRMFTLDDVLYGQRVTGAEISPSGAYVIATYSDTGEDGHPRYWQKLYDARTGKPMGRLQGTAQWLNNADRYYVERNDYEHGRHLVAIDPATADENVIATHLPKGRFTMAPTDDYLVYSLTREGPKEDPKVYQVLEPEDRQPGWRDRSYPAIYKLGVPNGALVPLTQGIDNVYVADISADGHKMLLMTSKSRLEKRPTTVTTVLLLDVPTMAVDTIVWQDGFVSSARFSPDATKALVTGTPEAFDRIGCTLPSSVTPSMIQQELFVVDLASKQVTPITRDFNPNIQSAQWNPYDGQVYTRVENRDCYDIFKINPATGAYSQLQLPENIVKGFSLSQRAPLMAWWGQSDSNPDGLYVTDLKKGTLRDLDHPSAERLKDVRIVPCTDWNFVSERGDTIYGRYYVPDNFDPAKKYPMIVYYYGGCSPTQRTFESRYPGHAYAQLGYVVYVVQPSGATGFGQEFSSRHVNTAGRGPAEDIIEGAQKFMAEHDFVDPSKVGCIGASYGGFMTQYLQTVTDIFAAAVSHAGISDHTSYWGEGYWGYSYSETSMANSYPWSHPDLYVKQSPLYNAHKVKTPLLFVHGDSDNNVPVGESIQMFTALKLLGCPTALVQVADQDHHILDYDKRKKWQDTIYAWFAKYLQDDPSWWDALYPAKM